MPLAGEELIRPSGEGWLFERDLDKEAETRQGLT